MNLFGVSDRDKYGHVKHFLGMVFMKVVMKDRQLHTRQYLCAAYTAMMPHNTQPDSIQEPESAGKFDEAFRMMHSTGLLRCHYR